MIVLGLFINHAHWRVGSQNMRPTFFVEGEAHVCIGCNSDN